MYNKKNIIIVVMCVAILFMSVIYAFYSTSLNIGSTGNITTMWSVKFTNLTVKEKSSGASSVVNSYTDATATMEANLALPGDYVLYELTLKNAGDVAAVIANINAEAKGSNAIIFSFEGLKIGDKLTGGQEVKLLVKIEYDYYVTSQPEDTRKTLTININAVQDTGEEYEGEGSTPSIDQPVLLSSQILKNNTAQSDATIDLSKPSTYTKYTESHATTATSQTFTSSTNYDFGTSYIFDESTGQYKLSGTITNGTWSSSQVGKYTCKHTGLGTLSANWCSTLYKIATYTSTTAGTAYAYTSTKGTETVSNGNGLYYTNTNTQNGGTTYYFRGAVDNNYVAFGPKESETSAGSCTYNGEPVYRFAAAALYDITDEATCKASSVCTLTSTANAGKHFVYSGLTESSCLTAGPAMTGSWTGASATWTSGTTTTYDMLWRIVRINEDGSVRLIKEDSLSVSNSYNSSTTVVYGSVMKTDLDSWYENNLKNNYSSYLADTGFCNDINVYKEVTGLPYFTYYSGFKRLQMDRIPEFKCQNSSRDLFTTSSATLGNKSLTYPIALLTADEAMYAGYTFGASNTNGYLSNGTSYWTMTPGIETVPDFHYVVSDSQIAVGYPGDGSTSHAARPVINLKASVSVISGNGTSTNPYVVKTN